MSWKRRAARLGADGERGVTQRRQQVGALDVEVHVAHRVGQRHGRVLRVCERAEQPVLLAVPDRDDHRAPCGIARDVARDRQGGRHTGGVVGGPVADRVAGLLRGARAAHVVVVRAHDHVLARKVGAGDHAEHVRAQVDRVRVRAADRVGDRLQLIQDVLAGRGGTGRVVVPPGRVVARESADVDGRAAGEEGARRDGDERAERARVHRATLPGPEVPG